MSTPSSSSRSTPFFMARSEGVSTVPSSPPPPSSIADLDDDMTFEFEAQEETTEQEDSHAAKLKVLIEKASLYASMLKEMMDKAKTDAAEITRRNEAALPINSTTDKPRVGQKRQRAVEKKDTSRLKRAKLDSSPAASDDDEDAEYEIDDEVKVEDDEEPKFRQPTLITGAQLKDYQLEGVAWMIGLYENGISGILADEMGLGKTLQTIAFTAYLKERITAPVLIVVPLSVLHNWVEEYTKFAPQIPICMYHGTPAERADLRKNVLVVPGDDDVVTRVAPNKKKAQAKGKGGGKGTGKAKKTTKGKGNTRKAGKGKATGRRPKRGEDDEDDENEDEDEDEPVETTPSSSETFTHPHLKSPFPVTITTPEILIRDAATLSKYNWGYIVVDEGHRLKNFECRLMRELRRFGGDRLVLSGTPLQNNLAELWSLLNFVLPEVFSDLDLFQEWFNLPQTQSPSTQTSTIISSLHAILKPFLLRRLKADVELGLPPKKEYVLYAPLSEQQREVYDGIVEGGLRGLLVKGVMNKAGGDGKEVQDKKDEDEKVGGDVDGPRRLRSGGGKGGGKTKGKKGGKEKERKVYDVDGDDDEYFARLEAGEFESSGKGKGKEKTVEEVGKDWHYRSALKQVNNLRLQNTIMQLRKACSHPFLFDWPTDRRTGEQVINKELVNASGKMMVLERLLDELFRRGHKVLIFSQFTTMLDIIEDWATEFKGWNLCRIDGSTAPLDRREEMRRFQDGGDAPDAPRLFLLSTRAGGLGINLTAADTVIFYDQDWNPQMDIQAQDRAHRIGQTKPVLIFRLVSKHTVETKIMQKAKEKRQLEALVIAKGKYKNPAVAASRNRPETMAEMAANLLKLEGEKIEVVPGTDAGKASVISDEDLEMLLDRSPEVFKDRGKGWTSAKEDKVAMEDAGDGKAKFAVFEGAVDQGNDALARMLGEDVE
ncbi:hypothetical protein JAAARDRAFT_184081 [Jaapia argillacea MUCL 33604]|uniref:Helicase ATP-binding domain-containing protein n=1 Tax=Jaapia argillacea MUCL 33604 TaxID=933084 RepID=A0A067PQB3_9AGAM|nr:hypothetical protein JAAARDRAFT_184081 [Jaapia argillacea MUCL 33604]